MPTFGYTPGGNAYPLNSSAYDQSEFWRLVALGRDVIDQQTKDDATSAALDQVNNVADQINGRVDTLLGDAGALRVRGQIPAEITALSQMNHASYNGFWQANTQHALTDAPFEITQATLVEVLIASPANAAKQVVSDASQSWWRESSEGGGGVVSAWGSWQKYADQDDITDQVSNAVSTALRARGDLPDGSNLDDMNNLSDSGVWRILSSNTYHGLPFSLTGAGVLKIESTANRTAVMQTVSDINRSMWRVTNTASSWGLWRSFNGSDDPAHAIVATSAASNWSQTARYFDKNADTLDRPASTLKVLTLYTARKTITGYNPGGGAILDNLVTITAEDVAANPGGSGGVTFQQGDELTYRNLFYAMMLPSSNWAAEIVARAVGEQLEGSGTAREKFLDAMRDSADEFGWEGYHITNPTGLGNGNQLSAAMLVQLMLACAEDSQMVTIMGSRERRLFFYGPNSREQWVYHTTDPDGEIRFPEMVAAKTGTLTAGDHRCLVMLWETPDGGYAASALLGSDTENRFKDMRALIDTTLEARNMEHVPMIREKVSSPTVKRIIAAPMEPADLLEGDLLITHQPNAVHHEDFLAGDAGWTMRWDSGNIETTSGEGETGGQALVLWGNDLNLKLLAWDVIENVADQEIEARLKFPNYATTPIAGLVARASGVAGNETGLMLAITRPTGQDPQVQLWLIEGGEYTLLTSQFRTDLPEDTWFRSKLGTLGNQVLGKIWVDGEVEPRWQLSATQESVTSGLSGVGARTSLRTVWDWVTIKEVQA